MKVHDPGSIVWGHFQWGTNRGACLNWDRTRRSWFLKKLYGQYLNDFHNLLAIIDSTHQFYHCHYCGTFLNMGSKFGYAPPPNFYFHFGKTTRGSAKNCLSISLEPGTETARFCTFNDGWLVLTVLFQNHAHDVVFRRRNFPFCGLRITQSEPSLMRFLHFFSVQNKTWAS